MPVKTNDDFAVIHIQKIIRLMEEQGVATPKDLVGVTEKEIKQLESHFKLEFPKAYRQYLTHFGRSAGLLSPWMAIYFDDLKEIREIFDLYVAQGLGIKLPKDALLVANFENTFDFILCNGAHDPAVYRVDFRQEKPSSAKHSPNFSSYLENLVKNSDISALPQDILDDDCEFLDDLMNY